MIAMLADSPFALPPGYVEVQSVDLTDALHTKTPWTLRLLQSRLPDADVGDKPAKACFVGGKDRATHCEDLKADGYILQTVKSAAVRPLSARANLQGVEVKSEFSGGAHTLQRTDVWTYQPETDSFLRTSGVSRSDLGDEERIASGPLDGFYIVADFLLGPGETRWSDHRYSMEVYKLDPRWGGYVQVLQYLSPTAYPSERDGPHKVIDKELPRTVKMLAAVYPGKTPAQIVP
jgi:hypothetical protein